MLFKLLGKRHNFNKYNDSKVDSLNSSYDYKSFMQYSKKAFGINDSITLDPKQKDVFQLGQRVGFTESDQYQAMKLYRCDGNFISKVICFYNRQFISLFLITHYYS